MLPAWEIKMLEAELEKRKLEREVKDNEAITRLAEYEDSGLTPEQVQELAKAKADGRLVVLPCKVGDTLFLIKHGYIEEAKVRTIFIGHPSYNRGEPEPNLMMIRCTNFDLPIDAIGKTAFLSREAAEKALGGVSDGN